VSATKPSARSPGAWVWALLAVILVLGAIVRLDGINFGLPYVYDIDEQNFVSLTITMLRNHDPNPHWFGHPGTTLLYLMCALYGAMYGAGRVSGLFAGPSSFEAAYLHDVSPFYLAARLLIVALGLISIVLTYRIGEKLFGKAAGILAAAFLAFSPLHVEYSQHIRSDMVMTVFVLAAFWFSLRIVESGSLRDYLYAGVSIGLATDSKYPALLMFVPLLIAHVFGPARRDARKVLWSALAFALTSFVASPFLYLDFPQTLRDLRVENRTWEFGGVGTGPIGNAFWYIQTPLQHAFTAAGLVGVAVGLAFLARDRRPQTLLLAVTPLALLVFLSCLHLRWERWIVPTVPFFALILSYGITRLCSVRVRLPSRAVALACALVTAGIFASMISRDAVSGAELRGTDTRTVMAAYILAHVPAGSALLSEIYTCQLPKERFRYYEVNEQTGRLRLINPRLLRHDLYEPFGFVSHLQAPSLIGRAGIEYILLNGDTYGEMRKYPDHYGRELATEQRLLEADAVVYQLQAQPGRTTGPDLTLLRVPSPSTSADP
jgi:hypothetical protein